MYAAVQMVPSPGRLSGIALKIVAGIIVYGALVVAFDREARGMLAAAKAQFAARYRTRFP
jgi:hypothetical protein